MIHSTWQRLSSGAHQMRLLSGSFVTVKSSKSHNACLSIALFKLYICTHNIRFVPGTVVLQCLPSLDTLCTPTESNSHGQCRWTERHSQTQMATPQHYGTLSQMMLSGKSSDLLVSLSSGQSFLHQTTR